MCLIIRYCIYETEYLAPRNIHVSFCYISTHSPTLVISYNRIVQESTMLSVSCGRLSLARQLHRIGFLTALTGWIAGPAFERGNGLV